MCPQLIIFHETITEKLYSSNEKHNLKANQVAIIGDQMFTDILGGNLAGLYTILTAPIAVKDRGVTKINRFFENIVYKVLEHKGDFKRGEFDD